MVPAGRVILAGMEEGTADIKLKGVDELDVVIARKRQQLNKLTEDLDKMLRESQRKIEDQERALAESEAKMNNTIAELERKAGNAAINPQVTAEQLPVYLNNYQQQTEEAVGAHDRKYTAVQTNIERIVADMQRESERAEAKVAALQQRLQETEHSRAVAQAKYEEAARALSVSADIPYNDALRFAGQHPANSELLNTLQSTLPVPSAVTPDLYQTLTQEKRKHVDGGHSQVERARIGVTYSGPNSALQNITGTREHYGRQLENLEVGTAEYRVASDIHADLEKQHRRAEAVKKVASAGLPSMRGVINESIPSYEQMISGMEMGRPGFTPGRISAAEFNIGKGIEKASHKMKDVFGEGSAKLLNDTLSSEYTALSPRAEAAVRAYGARSHVEKAEKAGDTFGRYVGHYEELEQRDEHPELARKMRGSAMGRVKGLIDLVALAEQALETFPQTQELQGQYQDLERRVHDLRQLREEAMQWHGVQESQVAQAKSTETAAASREKTLRVLVEKAESLQDPDATGPQIVRGAKQALRAVGRSAEHLSEDERRQFEGYFVGERKRGEDMVAAQAAEREARAASEAAAAQELRRRKEGMAAALHEKEQQEKQEEKNGRDTWRFQQGLVARNQAAEKREQAAAARGMNTDTDLHYKVKAAEKTAAQGESGQAVRGKLDNQLDAIEKHLIKFGERMTPQVRAGYEQQLSALQGRAQALPEDHEVRELSARAKGTATAFEKHESAIGILARKAEALLNDQLSGKQVIAAATAGKKALDGQAKHLTEGERQSFGSYFDQEHERGLGMVAKDEEAARTQRASAAALNARKNSMAAALREQDRLAGEVRTQERADARATREQAAEGRRQAAAVTRGQDTDTDLYYKFKAAEKTASGAEAGQGGRDKLERQLDAIEKHLIKAGERMTPQLRAGHEQHLSDLRDRQRAMPEDHEVSELKARAKATATAFDKHESAIATLTKRAEALLNQELSGKEVAQAAKAGQKALDGLGKHLTEGERRSFGNYFDQERARGEGMVAADAQASAQAAAAKAAADEALRARKNSMAAALAEQGRVERADRTASNVDTDLRFKFKSAGKTVARADKGEAVQGRLERQADEIERVLIKRGHEMKPQALTGYEQQLAALRAKASGMAGDDEARSRQRVVKQADGAIAAWDKKFRGMDDLLEEAQTQRAAGNEKSADSMEKTVYRRSMSAVENVQAIEDLIDALHENGEILKAGQLRDKMEEYKDRAGDNISRFGPGHGGKTAGQLLAGGLGDIPVVGGLLQQFAGKAVAGALDKSLLGQMANGAMTGLAGQALPQALRNSATAVRAAEAGKAARAVGGRLLANPATWALAIGAGTMMWSAGKARKDLARGEEARSEETKFGDLGNRLGTSDRLINDIRRPGSKHLDDRLMRMRYGASDYADVLGSMNRVGLQGEDRVNTAMQALRFSRATGMSTHEAGQVAGELGRGSAERGGNIAGDLAKLSAAVKLGVKEGVAGGEMTQAFTSALQAERTSAGGVLNQKQRDDTFAQLMAGQSNPFLRGQNGMDQIGNMNRAVSDFQGKDVAFLYQAVAGKSAKELGYEGKNAEMLDDMMKTSPYAASRFMAKNQTAEVRGLFKDRFMERYGSTEETLIEGMERMGVDSSIATREAYNIKSQLRKGVKPEDVQSDVFDKWSAKLDPEKMPGQQDALREEQGQNDGFQVAGRQEMRANEIKIVASRVVFDSNLNRNNIDWQQDAGTKKQEARNWTVDNVGNRVAQRGVPNQGDFERLENERPKSRDNFGPRGEIKTGRIAGDDDRKPRRGDFNQDDRDRSELPKDLQAWANRTGHAGRAGGGYGGDGDRYSVQGVFHGGEYVVNKAATQQFRPILDRLNGGGSPDLSSSRSQEVALLTGMLTELQQLNRKLLAQTDVNPAPLAGAPAAVKRGGLMGWLGDRWKGVKSFFGFGGGGSEASGGGAPFPAGNGSSGGASGAAAVDGETGAGDRAMVGGEAGKNGSKIAATALEALNDPRFIGQLNRCSMFVRQVVERSQGVGDHALGSLFADEARQTGLAWKSRGLTQTLEGANKRGGLKDGDVVFQMTGSGDYDKDGDDGHIGVVVKDPKTGRLSVAENSTRGRGAHGGRGGQGAKMLTPIENWGKIDLVGRYDGWQNDPEGATGAAPGGRATGAGNGQGRQGGAPAGAPRPRARGAISADKATSIKKHAKALGVDPNDLAAVMSFETGGTFNPNARNPRSSGTGLIQFMDATDGKRDGKYWGMTRDQFGGLSFDKQMGYVSEYLKERGVGKNGKNGLADIYQAVAGSGYRRGSQAYELNKVWDSNRNGVIEKDEQTRNPAFQAHVRDYFGRSQAQAAVAAMPKPKPGAHGHGGTQVVRIEGEIKFNGKNDPKLTQAGRDLAVKAIGRASPAPARMAPTQSARPGA